MVHAKRVGPGTLRAWVQALRPLAQGNLAPFLVVGALEACRFGARVDARGLAIALLWGFADHAVIVLANDLGDEAADARSTGATLVSGGSRVLVEGLLPRRALARALTIAVVALGIVSAGACAFVPERSGLIVAATAIALGLLYAYGAGPRLSYRGGGEWLQALGVGAVLPTMGAALQPRGEVPLDAVSYAALVLLGLAGNVATSIPDAEDDRASGKQSPAARFGVHRAFAVALALNAMALVLVGATRGWAVIGALPFFVLAVTRARHLDDRSRRMASVYPLAFGGGAIVLLWAAMLTLRA